MRELIMDDVLVGEDIQQGLEALQQLCEVAHQYGATEGLCAYGVKEGLLCSAAISVEAADDGSTLKNVGKAMNDGAKSNFVNKLKSYATDSLSKITSFGTHVDEKVTGFVGDTTAHISEASVKSGVKAIPAQAVTGAVNSVSQTTNALNRVSAAMNDVFTTPEGLESAKKASVEALNSIESPVAKISAELSGNHVVLKTEATKVAEASVTATKDAVTQTVTNFGGKSKGLWGALKRFGGALKSMLGRGLSWATSGFKVVSTTADSAGAGIIKGLGKQAAKGGLKGMVFGFACIGFATFLVNSVLKLIKFVLNSVSNVIESFVTKLTGKTQQVATDNDENEDTQDTSTPQQNEENPPSGT